MLSCQRSRENKHCQPAAVAPERPKNLSGEHLPVCAIRSQQLTASFYREEPTAALGALFWEGAGAEIPKSFGTKRALTVPSSGSQARSHHAGFESASGATEVMRSFAFCLHRRTPPHLTGQTQLISVASTLQLAKPHFISSQLLLSKLQAQLRWQQGRKDYCHSTGCGAFFTL